MHLQVCDLADQIVYMFLQLMQTGQEVISHALFIPWKYPLKTKAFFRRLGGNAGTYMLMYNGDRGCPDMSGPSQETSRALSACSRCPGLQNRTDDETSSGRCKCEQKIKTKICILFNTMSSLLLLLSPLDK